VFDEYSEMDPIAWDVIAPVIVNNDGWAVFIFTPKGKNHRGSSTTTRRSNPSGSRKCSRSTTRTSSQRRRLSVSGAMGVPRNLSSRSTTARSTLRWFGAIYGDQIVLAEKEGRLTTRSSLRPVAHDSLRPVFTAWDLGVSDSTAIWFGQQFGSEIRLIDYEEGLGQDLAHYARRLAARRPTSTARPCSRTTQPSGT